MNAIDFEMLLDQLMTSDVTNAEQLYRNLETMLQQGKLSQGQYKKARREYEQNRGDVGDADR